MKLPSPDTWMPLYIGDYLADTMHLDAQESGAYLHLIMHYWKNGGAIKNDIERLQNIARIKPSKTSKEALQTVLEFFEEREGYLYHKRIEEELQKAKENQKKNHDRTQAATAARKVKKGNVTNGGDSNVTNNVTSNVTLDVTTNDTNDATFTPPPPPSPFPPLNTKTPSSNAPPTSEGGFKKEGGVGLSVYQLSEKTLARARENAPKWDIYDLFNVYLKGITDGLRAPPNDVNAAFPGWCLVYTKGKPPSYA